LRDDKDLKLKLLQIIVCIIADLFNVENMWDVYPPPSAGDKQNQIFIFCELAIKIYKNLEENLLLNSKQRAVLKGIASTADTIGQIGKGGMTDSIIKQAQEALTARELVKYRVLESCPLSAREAAAELAEKTGSEVVQVIGSRLVLYRKNAEKPVIVL
jgi:RNA-binding protein